MKIKKFLFIGGILTVCLMLVLPVGFALADDLGVSQSNVSLNVGQNTTVSIYSYNNQALNIVYISDTYSVSAGLQGNILSLYGLQNGNSQIRVCSSDSRCVTIYVTVSGSGGGYYGDFSLSPSSISMTTNQNSSVSIVGNNYYTFYVSSNSNSDIVSAYISGTTVNLYAKQNGSSTISICANNYSTCRSLYVTVSGGYSGSSVYISPTSAYLTTNQSTTVYVYGGSTPYYISRNSNSSVVTASISGSTITLYGQNSGSSTITVCSSTYSYSSSNCADFQVTVTGYYGSSIYFMTTNLPQPVAGYFYSSQIQVSGGTSPYYFSIASGSLPSGLSLSSSGVISGYVASGSSSSFTVRVSDAYGRSATQYYTLTTSGQVLGTSIYNNGTLIRDSGTIYLTYKNTKTGFANMEAFNGLGYKLSNVIIGSTSGLTSSNYVIGTSATAHPWGSWIKAGNTIYFVHENGLIPISTYETFLNNGGQDKLVVPFNGYDFGKSILSVMGNNDERLRP